MKRPQGRATAIFMVLVMLLAQVSVVFADSTEKDGEAGVTFENEIASKLEETLKKDLTMEKSSRSTEGEADINKQSLQNSVNKESNENVEIIPNQIIVKYKSGTSSKIKSALCAKVSAVSSKSFDKLRLEQLRLPAGTDIESAMDKLWKDPSIEYVEPVYVRKAFGLEKAEASTVVESIYCDEPFYTSGWQWGLEAANMDELWAEVPIEERDAVTIAVVDSGVDAGHSEFNGNILEGYDFVNNDSDADDDNGHGTFVAGIAAAANDNKGMAGVAGGVEIMPVKVLDEYGNGSTVSIINGILYAVNNGADIVNLSLGGNHYSKAEEEVIDYASEKGVILVSSTGNDHGFTVCYPAAFDEVIAVGAVDWDGSEGKYVTADFTNIESGLDILAPGVDILSCIPIELDNPWNRTINGMGDEKKDGYTLGSGTSAAAPFVSGMAAMLLLQDNELNAEQILQAMKINGTPHKVERSGLKIDSFVINGSKDVKYEYALRRGILDIYYVDADIRRFKLCFSDYAGTVTDSVYGSFDLMRREYGYNNGFQWITEPEVVGNFNISEGKTSGMTEVSVAGYDKKYVFYVEGPEGYLNPNPVLYNKDGNNSADEAVTVGINTKNSYSIDYARDSDFYKFSVGANQEGYYSIYSTGVLDVDGCLYNSYMGAIRHADGGDIDGNFMIGGCEKYFSLYLEAGTYYVEVIGERSEWGNYGLNVQKLETITGNISLSNGLVPEDYYDEYISIDAIPELGYDEEFNLNSSGITVELSTYCRDTNYELIVEPGRKYFIQYHAEDYMNNCVYTGYYGANGTVPLFNNATAVVPGAADYNLTIIKKSDIDDNEMNTIENAGKLKPDQKAAATMHFDGDADIFELTITEKGNYVVGTETSCELNCRMNYGTLLDENGDYANRLGRVSWSDDSQRYIYSLYALDPGTYYYLASGYVLPFDKFAYKVGAKKSAVISGNISLHTLYNPNDFVDLAIIAEDPQGHMYVTYSHLNYTENYIGYSLGVPAADGYIVRYIVENYSDDWDYSYSGYYSTSGTKADASAATAIDATNNATGIDMDIYEPGGTEDGTVENAKKIELNKAVNGNFVSSEDVDYYKFTIPSGGGDYLIYTNAYGGISVYLEQYVDGKRQWTLYDQDEHTIIGRNFAAGDYYIKVCGDVLYNGIDYILMVIPYNKPIATSPTISGTAEVGETLTGSYIFSDKDGNTESGSTYIWLRSNTSTGEYTAIAGATSRNYTLTSADQDKYIKFEVTPKTTTEPTTGAAVQSNSIGPVAAASTNPSNGGGGSHGGGGGGSSVETTTDANTTTEQTQAGSAAVTKGTDGKTTVDIKVDSSKLGSALAAPGSTPVTIDVNTKSNPDKLDVNTPSSVFSQAAQASKPVVVNSNSVDFSFQPGTFDAGSLNGNVKLEVSQLTIDSVPDAMKKMNSSSDEVSLVFDFGLTIGGNKVMDFNKPVTVTIKFDPSKVTDLSKVGVYYYNEKNGTWEYVGGKANPDGTITFTLDHFSKYMAMEYKKTFADINKHWAKADIELLIAKHVARSQSETSFAPDSNITRAAFASMIVKALDLKDNSSAENFKDIAAGTWYAEDVYKAYTAGIIEGISSTEFAPDQMITREQMATMLMKAYERATGEKLDGMAEAAQVKFSDESSISSWAKRNVVLANTVGLVAGNPDGSYNPKGNMTKAQAVVVIKRLMEKLNRL